MSLEYFFGPDLSGESFGGLTSFGLVRLGTSRIVRDLVEFLIPFTSVYHAFDALDTVLCVIK